MLDRRRTATHHGPWPSIPAVRLRPVLRPWAVATLAGLVAYCDFPLQWIIGSPLSPMKSYISELSVSGQPANLVFRIGDVVAGIGLAVLAGVLAIWRSTPLMRLGSTALIVTAAASIIDATSPMNCAPSIDSQCWAADHAPLGAQLSQLHTVSGVIGFTAVVIAMTAYGAELRHQPRMRRLGAAGLALAATGAVLGSIEVITVLAGTDWTGLFERIHVVIVSAWLASLTIVVARSA